MPVSELVANLLMTALNYWLSGLLRESDVRPSKGHHRMQMLADREGVAWELHTSSFVLNFESLTQTVTNIAAIFMLQELYFTSTSVSKMRSCELSFPLKMERYPATSGGILA